MVSAYDNIKKLNSILSTGQPLTDRNRAEFDRLGILLKFQLADIEQSQESIPVCVQKQGASPPGSPELR